MNGININNLFLDNNNKIKSNDPLTVHSLFNKNVLNDKKDNSFITAKLINERKKRKYLALIEYRKILKACISDIDRVNGIGYDSMIFSVPNAVINNIEYDKLECVEYLYHKLQELSFEVTKIDTTKLLVSWANIYKYK